MPFEPSSYSDVAELGAVGGAQSLSASGRKFLEHEEGIRRTVYNDKTGKSIKDYSQATGKGGAHPGYPTIGLGLALLTDDLKTRYRKFLAKPVGRPMTDAELDASITEAIAPRARQLNNLLKRPVNQNQWDALFSFMYNRGAAGRGFPSVISEINSGESGWERKAAAYIAAAAAYESVPHIKARRLREAALFSGSTTLQAAGRVAEGAAVVSTSPIAYLLGSALVIGGLVAYRRHQARA